MTYKPDPEIGLAVQKGLIHILERQNIELQAQLRAEKERAEYALRNLNITEKARQDEMAKRDELLIRCADAEKELAALRQRIANAPVVAVAVKYRKWLKTALEWNGVPSCPPGTKLISKEDLL